MVAPAPLPVTLICPVPLPTLRMDSWSPAFVLSQTWWKFEVV
jgi:hypothetical protein